MNPSLPAWADASAPQKKSFVDTWRQNLASTWQSQQYDVYVPLYTWHNSYTYTRQQLAEYNDYPLGLGWGKHRYDQDGDWHALYAMAFLDSHHKIEPIAGYGYEKMWYPAESWRLGVGFTAGVTARQDYSYIPIPLVLPLVSLEYGAFALQSTYVPGTKGNGNVLFTWLRWQY